MGNWGITTWCTVLCTSTAVCLLKLMPTYTLTEDELKSIVSLYKDDLPSPELIKSELLRWRQCCSEDSVSISAALDQCDADIFPNINILLR